MKITPFREEHLEDAALLVSHRYQRLCEQERHLPCTHVSANIGIRTMRGTLRADEPARDAVLA